MSPWLSVSALRLLQFRSHPKTEIACDGRPVALFGPNGAGKTNILEALSLLSPGRGLRRAGSGEIGRTAAGVGWKVAATLDAPDRPHEVATWAEADQASRSVEIDGKPAPQSALGRIARVLWLVPAMDRLWIEGAAERRRFLDRITLSLEPSHGEVSLAYEKAMRERNRLLKDQVRDDAWFAGLEAQMARAGATIMANRAMALDRLGAAQTGAETAFPRADLSLRPAEDGAEDGTGAGDEAALAAAFAGGRARDMAAGRTLVGPHRDDLSSVYAAKGLDARQCSTGEQKALLVSLILANARALAEDLGAAPILLLDEVAAHLDPGRRGALYDELTAMGAQAWMTGTEAALFADLKGRAQILSVREEDGQSVVEPGDV